MTNNDDDFDEDDLPVPVFIRVLRCHLMAFSVHSHRKKLLLDQFATEGSDVPATLVCQRIEDSGERLGYHAYYTYQSEPGSSTTYRKEYVYTRTGLNWGNAPVLDRSFGVKLLRGFPRSGVPKLFVDNRSREFGFPEIVTCGILTSVFVGGSAAVFCYEWTGESAISLSSVLVASAATSAAFLLLALPVARHRFNKWRNDILEKETSPPIGIDVPDRDRAMATAEPIREGACSAIPIASVSYVSNNGSQASFASEERENHVPLLVTSLTEVAPCETIPVCRIEESTPMATRATSLSYGSIL